MKATNPPEQQTAKSVEVQRLVRRLGVHRRRLRYWANLPGMYGPSGKMLRRREEFYELAKDDADSIARDLHKLTGTAPRVVDPLRTFQNRYHNPSAPEVLIYPPNGLAINETKESGVQEVDCCGLLSGNYFACGECEGRGTVRANYEHEGKYIFRREVCEECEGTGKGDTEFIR